LFTVDEVAAVVDGGDCDGEPSSVVDCARRRPTCVRDGAISWSEIEAVLGL
jgi:tRNA A37 threonylcarbamoyladenosine synthetase subunit TsaC/SUA5/YrdC